MGGGMPVLTLHAFMAWSGTTLSFNLLTLITYILEMKAVFAFETPAT
jgi:hypothetical protein